MIQKTSFRKIINLDIKKRVIVIKKIDLNTKIETSTMRTIADLICEIHSNNIYMEMPLIEQNAIILLPAGMIRLKI